MPNVLVNSALLVKLECFATLRRVPTQLSGTRKYSCEDPNRSLDT